MFKHNNEDLNQLYDDAKSQDKEAVAEMRSNILLIAGDHYSKKMSEWWSRSRTSSAQTQDNLKLRITKNWLHRAHRLYVSSILSLSPGTSISPQNKNELQDQKDAELNQSVWKYAKDKYKLKEHFRNGCSDFCGIGEVCTLIKYDPKKGYLKGYEHQVDESGQPMHEPVTDPMTGQPAVDPMTGQPVQGKPVADMTKPVFSGEFVFERVYGHQLFRDPSAKQMKDSKFLGVERLDSTKSLKRMYADQPDKLKLISESSDEYVVFDTARGGYAKEKDQTCLREFYFKPCHEYPKGYFYIKTKEGILEEGELPAGVFPIVWAGFDEHPTKARATSMVKVGRPWQAEINRASSQVAMHQVTVSEDKVLYQAGAKLSQGSLLPGVRGIQYQGAPPQVLPGRAGDQYFEYIAIQQAEMDKALMLDILDQEKLNNLDPTALLFRSMSQTQKFSFYSEKFGEYLVAFTETFLELAKFYLPDDEVIAMIGRSEQINLQEFKDTHPLCHKIHVEEQNDTIETKLGSQIMFNHILQYVGQQLSREDIGKLISNMPFGNWEDSFGDFTLDSKNVKNDFLAMERGEQPAISNNDNSNYILQQVAKRKKERDFQLLQPQVQQLYGQYEQFHEQKVAQEAQALKQAESQYIPASGAMIACDMYVPAEDATKAPKRVRVPYQALDWLIKTLEQQGMSMQAMEQMNQSQMADVAQQLLGGSGQPQGQPNNGQVSPGVLQ